MVRCSSNSFLLVSLFFVSLFQPLMAMAQTLNDSTFHKVRVYLLPLDAQQTIISHGSCNVVSSTEHSVVILTGDPCAGLVLGDVPAAQTVRMEMSNDAIYFEEGGKSYVVHDKNTLIRARELLLPVEQLGLRETDIKRQEEDLDARKTEVSERRGQQATDHIIEAAERNDTWEWLRKIQDIEAQLRKLSTGRPDDQHLKSIYSELVAMEKQLHEAQEATGEEHLERINNAATSDEREALIMVTRSNLELQRSNLSLEQSQRAGNAGKKLLALVQGAITQGLATPTSE